MRPEERDGPDLGPYLHLTEKMIEAALQAGVPGDVGVAQRRLAQLTRRSMTDAETRKSPPVWNYLVEREVVLAQVRGALAPDVRDRLVDVMGLDGRQVERGVWLLLDSQEDEQAEDRSRARAEQANATFFLAVRRYADRPHCARIGDAVRAVEQWYSAQFDLYPVWDADVLRIEASRLAKAIGEVLPPSAREVLCSSIQAQYRSISDGHPNAACEPIQYWRSVVKDRWFPVWMQVPSDGGQPEVSGTWFQPESQDFYEAKLAEMETRKRDLETAAERAEDRVTESSSLTIDAVSGLEAGEGRAHDDMEDPASIREVAPISLGELEMIFWAERQGQNLDPLLYVEESRSGRRRQRPLDESITDDDILRAWCGARELTPKNLIPEDRVSKRAELVARFRAIRLEVTGSDKK